MLENLEDKICAGIVLFHPNKNALVNFVTRLSNQVNRIIFYLNSPIPQELVVKIQTSAPLVPIDFINNGVNDGLGEAYNQLFKRARFNGFTKLVIFDQDSLPSPNMVRQLAARLDSLISFGEAPAAIGPLPLGRDSVPLRSARLRRRFNDSQTFCVDFIISSGTLFDLEATEIVGEFRSDFFIDLIDIEWCYRANAAGLSIWRTQDIFMQHELGDGLISFLGINLTKQPPKRLYTFFRNQIILLKLKHIPLAYKARALVSLPARILIYWISSDKKQSSLSASLYGVFDGLLNRMGSLRSF